MSASQLDQDPPLTDQIKSTGTSFDRPWRKRRKSTEKHWQLQGPEPASLFSSAGRCHAETLLRVGGLLRCLADSGFEAKNRTAVAQQIPLAGSIGTA
jgi:hypothetical protein